MANNMQLVVKISGYLDKKARLRIGSPWKKYWFVLEGRLLLYYRSKDEYETLSPCKGSINLCPPCNIQPSSSTNCIFQIQCRVNTVTLRAENRSDQDKWMQALLAAIDQSKSSPTRMSHFRYSLDDLPTPTKEKKKSRNEFFRQNSMPHRTSNKTSENLIERLQTIGAHTYGGSLETIVRLSAKGDLHSEDEEPSDSQNLNFLYDKISEPDSILPNQSHNNKDRHQNFIIENDQYSVIQEENSIDLLSHVETSKTTPGEVIVENPQYAGFDLIPEMVKTAIVENDQYASSDIPNSECVRRNNHEKPKVEHLYERISRDFNITEKGGRNSLNVGNLYEAVPGGCDNLDTVDVSDQYSVVQKRDPVKNLQKTEDHNKNSLIIDNDQYISNRNSTESTTYSEAKILMPNYMEYDTIDKNMEQETIYEDPDTIKKNIMYDSKTDVYQYVEPVLPPRPDSKRSEEETSSQASSQDNKIKKKKKLFKMFHKIEKKSEPNIKPTLKKRSTSFLRKMWRRKTKSLDNEDDDIIYETVDYELVKKQVAHQCDIEMLEELEKILQLRKDMLQQKLKSYENKLNSDKKETTAKWAKKATESKNDVVNETCNDERRPSLPPRQNSHVSLSNKLETLEENENVKSIDEILQELDKETHKSKKVKELIEKFNDIQTIVLAVETEEEEVKRRKPRSELFKSPSDTKVMEIINAKRDSGDELNQLLEELAKVTYAPIMTPGVTSSLITPILSDEEWLNLIPIRRRRSSDPDYDVPRPHSSLLILERSRPNSDNPIPITRFFGPILPPSQTDTIVTLRSSISMDPDSLEAHNNILENIERPILPSLNESPMEREHSISCIPHNYALHDHIIYAHPKNLFSSNINNNKILDEFITKNLGNCEVIKNNNNEEKPNEISTFTLELKPEEIFADSLEPITEISTVF